MHYRRKESQMEITTKIVAKDLAKLSSQLRHFGQIDVGVEYIKGGARHTLRDVRPDINESGRPTVRTIRATQDGHERHFDGNYEFEVTALLVGDKRWPVGGTESKS